MLFSAVVSNTAASVKLHLKIISTFTLLDSLVNRYSKHLYNERSLQCWCRCLHLWIFVYEGEPIQWLCWLYLFLCELLRQPHNCFDCAKHGLLQKPSYAMFSLCSSIEKVVQLNIESCVNAQHGVVHQLFDLVLSAVDVYSYSLPSVCGSHQLQQTTLWVKKNKTPNSCP